MKSFAASNAYVSAVHDLIPGGAHTYAKGDDQYPAGMAPVIEGGTGCRVRDIDGNEYVEFGSGLRSNLLGHGFEPVLRAARRWLDDGVNFVRPHRIELEAAERITDLIPSAEMVKFGLNGSDATTAAVRLARAYTGRDMVAVCRDQPFFSTDDWFIVTTPMSAGIPEATRRLTAAFSYNDLDDLAALFDMYPGQIAAVVMEAETGGPPAPGYFDGVRRLCDRHGALLVLDEMITGFRWHERGAQFVHGIEPDLCTFGKGIANGFPVSALAGRRDVMRLGGFVDDADRVFLLSQTAGAQPWALAAMLAAIDCYEQDRISDRLQSIGGELRRRVDEVVAGAGLSSVLRGAGTGLQPDLPGPGRRRAAQPGVPDAGPAGVRRPGDSRAVVRGVCRPRCGRDPTDHRGRGRVDAGVPARSRMRHRSGASRAAGPARHQGPRISADKGVVAMSIRTKLAKPVNDVLRPMRVQLVSGSSSDPAIQDFLPARKTIAAAQKAGLPLGAYIDRTFAKPGATPETVRAMLELANIHDKCGTVCEIGPGSGRFAEEIIAAAASRPLRDLRDSEGLAAPPEPAAERVIQECDGRTLSGRPTAPWISCTPIRSSSTWSSSRRRDISRRWPGWSAPAGPWRSTS